MLLLTTSLGQSQDAMIFNPAGAADMMLTQSFVTVNFPGTSKGFCGGTVLGTSFKLSDNSDSEVYTEVSTAAHCVETADPNFIVVKAHDREYPVVDIFIHPDYKKGFNEETGFAWQNDVAILWVQGTMIDSKGDDIPPQVLANDWLTGVYEDFGNGIVIGQGLDSSGTQPDSVMAVPLKILSNDTCVSILQFFGLNKYKMADEHICTRGVDEFALSTVCNGDSGGPLLAPYVETYLVNEQLIRQIEYAQIGYVSWRHRCGIGTPDVYTRVASESVMDFIHKWVESPKIAYQ